MDFNSRQVLRL